MSPYQRIRSELQEIGFVTLYFLGCFLIFLSLKKLFLKEYDVEITILGTAVVGALVVAKVVVLLGKTSFGRRFRTAPVYVDVIWRSVAYTAAVFAVGLAERLFDLYRDIGEFPRAMLSLWADRDFHHFLAMNICLALSFVVYNVFAEISRHMGNGALRRLFFTRRSTGIATR